MLTDNQLFETISIQIKILTAYNNINHNVFLNPKYNTMNALQNFILGFICTILLSFTLNAQDQDYTLNENKSPQNNTRLSVVTMNTDNTESGIREYIYRTKAEIDDIPTEMGAGKRVEAEIDDIATAETERAETLIVEFKNSTNPVVDRTVISYTLKTDAFVSFTVYDSNGCLVEKLLEQTRQYKNSYQVDFDASSLISGLYYACLTVDGKTSAIKILVQ